METKNFFKDVYDDFFGIEKIKRENGLGEVYAGVLVKGAADICNEIGNLLKKSDDNELKIFSDCDNSDICTHEGCLNCINDNECVICNQGYYLLSGECKKCIDGCSFCSDNETCIYCLSGYELDEQNQCQLTRKFDFNVEYYQIKKKS